MAKPIRLPTKSSIKEKIKEFDENGRSWFVNTYANACPAVCHYVKYNDKLYDLKALYASAHTPKVSPRKYNSQQVIAALCSLDFTCITTRTKDEYLEGERQRREIQILQRSSALIKKVKSLRSPICDVCDFNFEKTYGPLGKNYIECHHIDQLSGRDGVTKPTKAKDIALLCANCHRMVHRESPCLKVSELKAKLRN